MHQCIISEEIHEKVGPLPCKLQNFIPVTANNLGSHNTLLSCNSVSLCMHVQTMSCLLEVFQDFTVSAHSLAQIILHVHLSAHAHPLNICCMQSILHLYIHTFGS